ncbi:MAG: hypothetical protein V2A65_04605 [Candidatus Omnitrophota bacterium]
MKTKLEIKERLDKAKQENNFFEHILLGFAYEFYDKGVEIGFQNTLSEYSGLLQILKSREIKDLAGIEICEKFIDIAKWVLEN